LTWKHIRARQGASEIVSPHGTTLRADLRSGRPGAWPGRDQSGRIQALRGSPHNPCTADSFCIPGRSALSYFRGASGGRSLRKRSRPISRVLSRTIIHLRYASPRTSSDLPGSLCGPHVLPHPRTGPLAPLFGLAPGGVCRAAECCHRRGALLPHPFTLTAPFAGGLAVYFLLHFPWAHAPQALPGALPWEPGLSSTLARSDCLADSGRDGGVDSRSTQVIC